MGAAWQLVMLAIVPAVGYINNMGKKHITYTNGQGHTVQMWGKEAKGKPVSRSEAAFSTHAAALKNIRRRVSR